jgi:hypothetical protein
VISPRSKLRLDVSEGEEKGYMYIEEGVGREEKDGARSGHAWIVDNRQD